MWQLPELEVLAHKPVATLTSREKETLQYFTFLKKRRDGRAKGRGYVDGCKQHFHTAKSEVSSPTIAANSKFLILVIAGEGKRDLMMMDVPRPFLQTLLSSERLNLKLYGRIAELLFKMDLNLYCANISMENGKPGLFAELRKLLYVMLQTALRFWEQIMADLVNIGFKSTSYIKCMTNMNIDGAQQNVGWRFDVFMVTQVNPRMTDEFARWFDAKHGKRTPLAVHCGLAHVYLGVCLVLSDTGKMRITILIYITKRLVQCPSVFADTSITPAGMHLFKTSNEICAIDETRAAKLLHMTAKTLFRAKRARPDIHLAFLFPCARMREPDEYD